MLLDIFIGCLITLGVVIIAMVSGSTTRALIFCIKEYSEDYQAGKKDRLRSIRSYIVILSVIMFTCWAGILVLLETIYELF